MKNREILKGKNCLITGATGGIGSSIANALLDIGCNVFLTARDKKRLDAICQNSVNRASKKSITVTGMPCDLSRLDEINSLINSVNRSFSTVDILINCAGLFPVATVEETTIEDFDKCFAVNVRAPFILSKKVIPEMVINGWGRVVNIGSSSAYNGFPGTSVYCASKNGLLGLSRSLFHEFKGENVRVFSISPGSAQTPMGEKVLNQDYATFIDPKEIAEYLVDVISYDGNMISEEIRLNRILVQ